MKKYLCMKEGCDFCSEDIQDAYDHIKEMNHDVTEVRLENGKCNCSQLEPLVSCEELTEENY